MSLPDGAEYWWDVKGYNRPHYTKKVFCECKTPYNKPPYNRDRYRCKICHRDIKGLRDEVKKNIPNGQCCDFPRFGLKGEPYKKTCKTCGHRISRIKYNEVYENK